MRVEHDLLMKFVDGQLDAGQQQQLVDLLQADPQLSNLLVDELRSTDLIARELDPNRVDAEFLGGLFTRLEIDFGDGGFDDGSGDAGSDGHGVDGQGIDSTGMDGWDAVSGFDVPVVDPGTVGAAAGSSGATAGGGAAVSTGGGILGWVVGGVLAVAVGTTAVVMNKAKPTPPPPSFEVIASGDDMLPPAVSQIAPSLDISLYGRWQKSDAESPALGVVQDKWWMHTRTIHLKFDLRQLPHDYRRVRLRLYCLSTGENVQPLGVWHTHDEWTIDAPEKATDRRAMGEFRSGAEHNAESFLSSRELEKIFARWEPKAMSYWEIDVTEIVRAEQATDGVVSFGIASLLGRLEDKNPQVMSFASSEHRVANQRPVLIIERSQ